MENASIPPLQLNPALSLLLTQLKDKQRDDKSLSLKKVADFFMILTLCNTVVVAKHPHHDKVIHRNITYSATWDTFQFHI